LWKNKTKRTAFSKTVFAFGQRPFFLPEFAGIQDLSAVIFPVAAHIKSAKFFAIFARKGKRA
jgi:hypothetical protein